jgi:hypothetical protein
LRLYLEKKPFTKIGLGGVAQVKVLSSSLSTGKKKKRKEREKTGSLTQET